MAHETYLGIKGEWHIWQDSPAYGCDDNPSFQWFANRVEDGHIVETVGPFATEGEVYRAAGATPVAIARIKAHKAREGEARDQATHTRGKAENAATAIAGPGDQHIALIREAEMAGYSAGLAAQGIGRNPHSPSTHAWRAWLDGYRTGYAYAKG